MEVEIKKEFFLQLEGTAAQLQKQDLWTEVEKAYTSKARFYHNLDHLDQLLIELKACHELHSYWSEVVLAIVYHDIIYSIRRQDNEDRSADLAVSRLLELGWLPGKIELVRQLILATKGHIVSSLDLINYFTDADLAILGKSAEMYQLYSAAIRKEYKIFPDFLYRKGRKKVLLHFLELPKIYKTAHFNVLYESQARLNIEWEINQLN
jgi:predicted metal-dependent HD superfamily phosphohydrolase